MRQLYSEFLTLTVCTIGDHGAIRAASLDLVNARNLGQAASMWREQLKAAIAKSQKVPSSKIQSYELETAYSDSLRAVVRERRYRANQYAHRSSYKRYTFTWSKRGITCEASIETKSTFLTRDERYYLRDKLLACIREARRRARATKVNATAKTLSKCGVVAIERTGLVHLKNGAILAIARQAKKRAIRTSKKPNSAKRHVGIEIEFLAPWDQNEIEDFFADANLQDHVHLTTDGSVRWMPDADHTCEDDDCTDCGNDSGMQGHELCVLANEREFPEIIERVCAVLNEQINAQVNKTCGLHIHLDTRHYRAPEIAYANLFHAYPLLAAMVPKSRRKNDYCRAPKHVDMVSERNSTNRYQAINVQSLREHGTIEVRLHTGTTNASKIVNWITLLIEIVDANKQAELQRAYAASTEDLSLRLLALKNALDLPRRLERYVEARIQKFGGKINEILDENAA